MKNVLTILSMVLLPLSGLFAQQQVMVRVMESQAKRLSFIALTYDTGASEEIELQSLGMTYSAANLIANQKVIMGLVQRLKGEGFELTHISHTGVETLTSTVMLFEKPE